MMYLRTGTPGAGKTLSTIDEVQSRAIKENRPVYYTNIKDVTLENWFELPNGETWSDEIPDNAIYFCDEFYEVFPKLPTGKKRPDYYQLLAKHRHRGLDVYLVCQGVQQIDDFLKPLFENHYHLIRSEMADQSKVFRSQGFINSPHLKSNRRDLETKIYRFNKKLYGTYHSATQNTHIKRIPKAYKYMAFSLILLAFLIYFVINFFKEKTSDVQAQNEPQNQSQFIESGATNENSLAPKIAYEDTEKELDIIELFKPRIKNMPETAPAYDDLRKAKSFPRPQCMISALNGCKCYTQQATLMKDYPDELCRDFVENGYYQPAKEDSALNGEARRRGRLRGRERADGDDSDNIDDKLLLKYK